MNVVKINEYLSGDYDAIIALLEALNLPNITINRNRHEIRCSREYGTNPTSVKIDVDTLFYKCFSTGSKGSIYVLIMERLDYSFPKALQWVCNVLGLDKRELNTEVKFPFGGYYKNIIKEADEPELYIPTYSEDILNGYFSGYSSLFAKEGINSITQRKFRVGYDPVTMRTTIPQWSVNGELIGVMGRLNETGCDKSVRWLPIIPCSRSLTVYGYHMNYVDIQQKRICLVLESEKSVMQMDSMGLNFGLATCTDSVSDTQAKYIKGLMVENVILGYDEGVDEENIRASAQKIVTDNPVFKNRVGYIFDDTGEVLPKGSKASPTDLGIDVLRELMRRKVKWL